MTRRLSENNPVFSCLRQPHQMDGFQAAKKPAKQNQWENKLTYVSQTKPEPVGRKIDNLYDTLKAGKEQGKPAPKPSQNQKQPKNLSTNSGAPVKKSPPVQKPWHSLPPEVISLFYSFSALEFPDTRNFCHNVSTAVLLPRHKIWLDALRTTCKRWAACLPFVELPTYPLNERSFPFLSSVRAKSLAIYFHEIQNLKEFLPSLTPNLRTLKLWLNGERRYGEHPEDPEEWTFLVSQKFPSLKTLVIDEWNNPTIPGEVLKIFPNSPQIEFEPHSWSAIDLSKGFNLFSYLTIIKFDRYFTRCGPQPPPEGYHFPLAREIHNLAILAGSNVPELRIFKIHSDDGPMLDFSSAPKLSKLLINYPEHWHTALPIISPDCQLTELTVRSDVVPAIVSSWTPHNLQHLHTLTLQTNYIHPHLPPHKLQKIQGYPGPYFDNLDFIETLPSLQRLKFKQLNSYHTKYMMAVLDRPKYPIVDPKLLAVEMDILLYSMLAPIFPKSEITVTKRAIEGDPVTPKICMSTATPQEIREVQNYKPLYKKKPVEEQQQPRRGQQQQGRGRGKAAPRGRQRGGDAFQNTGMPLKYKGGGWV